MPITFLRGLNVVFGWVLPEIYIISSCSKFGKPRLRQAFYLRRVPGSLHSCDLAGTSRLESDLCEMLSIVKSEPEEITILPRSSCEPLPRLKTEAEVEEVPSCKQEKTAVEVVISLVEMADVKLRWRAQVCYNLGFVNERIIC